MEQDNLIIPADLAQIHELKEEWAKLEKKLRRVPAISEVVVGIGKLFDLMLEEATAPLANRSHALQIIEDVKETIDGWASSKTAKSKP